MAVLARAVQARGHRVTLISSADGVSHVEANGFEAVPFGQRLFPAGEWDRRAAIMGAAEGRAVVRHSLELLLDQGQSIVEDLPGLLPKLGMDALVMDQLSYAGESVAQALRIPLGVACNALPLHRESAVPLCMRHWAYNAALWARIRNRLDGAWTLLWGWRMSVFYLQHRRALGLPPPRLSDINDLRPSRVQVAQLPAFLDFPRRRLPRHFHYTGPWVEAEMGRSLEFPWDQLGQQPLIYASLGTLQNRVQRLYEVITTASAGLPALLVLGLGRSGEIPTFPGRPLVVNFAPQRQLLQRAALFVTHAGLNSALESLLAAVPMVALPLAHEQPGIAARLARAGVAVVIRREHLTPERLRAAIALAINDPTLRQCAMNASRRLRDLNGPAQAASLLEGALIPRAAPAGKRS